MSMQTTKAEVGVLESAEIVQWIRRHIENSCNAMGTELQTDAIGKIYWTKPGDNQQRDEVAALRNDYDIQSLRGRSHLNVFWREIGLGDEAELLRADLEGWTSVAFSVIQPRAAAGCEVHFGVFPWVEDWEADVDDYN